MVVYIPVCPGRREIQSNWNTLAPAVHQSEYRPFITVPETQVHQRPDIENIRIIHRYSLHPYAVLNSLLHGLGRHSGVETVFGNRFYPVQFAAINIRIFFFPFRQWLQIHALVRQDILTELRKIQMLQPVSILPYIERILDIPYQIFSRDIPDIENRFKFPFITGGDRLERSFHRITRHSRQTYRIHFTAISAIRLSRIRPVPCHIAYQIQSCLEFQCIGLVLTVMSYDMFQFFPVVSRIAESLPHILPVWTA